MNGEETTIQEEETEVRHEDDVVAKATETDINVVAKSDERETDEHIMSTATKSSKHAKDDFDILPILPDFIEIFDD